MLSQVTFFAFRKKSGCFYFRFYSLFCCCCFFALSFWQILQESERVCWKNVKSCLTSLCIEKCMWTTIKRISEAFERFFELPRTQCMQIFRFSSPSGSDRGNTVHFSLSLMAIITSLTGMRITSGTFNKYQLLSRPFYY